MTQIQFSYLSITKQQAKYWLSKNQQNRRLSEQKVLSYVHQMNTGQWQQTGDPIRFTGNYERLIDGQHRLTAFVQSNLQELPVLVANNVDPDAFKVLDTGKVRSAGDVLHIAGYKNAGRLAAATKAIINLSKGLVAFDSSGYSLTINGTGNVSNADVQNFIESEPEMVEIVNQANNWYKVFAGLSSSEYAAYFYHFSKKNKESANTFLNMVATGINLDYGHPAYALRRRLEKDIRAGKKMVGKMRQALVIYCWNAYRKGKEVRNISIKYEDALPPIL